MNHNELISIVVIAYNAENDIKRCLDSIIDQTYKNIEIIVIDDGSKDSTSDIVKKYTVNDSRVFLYSQKNMGIIEARKTGLKKATGKFITFIDSDDWVSNDLIFKLYNSMISQNNIDIVIADNINVNGRRQINGYYNKCEFNKVYYEYEYLKMILEQKILHNMFSKLYRREFILSTNYLEIKNISMGEDLIAQIVFAISKPNVIVINENLYYYVQNTTSYSHSNSDKIYEIFSVLQLIEKILEDNNLKEKFSIEIQYLYFSICYRYYVMSWYPFSYSIRKAFFIHFKNKDIKIEDNNLITETVRKFSIINKIVYTFYNISFNIGFLVQIILIYVKKIFKWYEGEKVEQTSIEYKKSDLWRYFC